MKITVHRPKLAHGLGAPVAFIDDDHPKQGEWVQSSKAEVSDRDEPPRLLMLGRAFLIYSMYHAREPRFLGYAVENFGAACQKLGYSLPLNESEANWLTYGPDDLEIGDPADYQFMLRQIASVFGHKAADEQASKLGTAWAPEPRPSITPEELAERMKAEIVVDVVGGIVPPTVRTFSQLHDYVDANCYGGTEALLEELDRQVPDTDEGHSASLAALCDLCNPAQEIVNNWIAEGGICELSRSWPQPPQRQQ